MPVVDDQHFGRLPGQGIHGGDDGVLHEDVGAVAPDGPVVAPGLYQDPAFVIGLDVQFPAVGLGKDGPDQLQGHGLLEEHLPRPHVVKDAAVEGDEVAPGSGELQPPGLLDGADQGTAGGDDHPVPGSQGLLNGGAVAGGDLLLVVEQGAVQVQEQRFAVAFHGVSSFRIRYSVTVYRAISLISRLVPTMTSWPLEFTKCMALAQPVLRSRKSAR